MRTLSTPWHDVLGVPPNASREQILAAYRRACRSCHPDAGGNAAMFRLVTAARDELLCEAQNSHYAEGPASEPWPEPGATDSEWEVWEVGEPHERAYASGPGPGEFHARTKGRPERQTGMFDLLARIPVPRTRREWFGVCAGWCILGIALENWAGRVPVIGALISLAVLAFFPVLTAAAAVQWIRKRQGRR